MELLVFIVAPLVLSIYIGVERDRLGWGIGLGLFGWLGLAIMFICVKDKRPQTTVYYNTSLENPPPPPTNPLVSNAGWYDDPGRVHYKRYHDGSVWTPYVSNSDGQVSTDNG